MENLMILPAVEPKRISWLNEYATDEIGRAHV